MAPNNMDLSIMIKLAKSIGAIRLKHKSVEFKIQKSIIYIFLYIMYDIL